MSKQLTDAQREFITKFVTGASKRQESTIIEAYLDYERRRQKVLIELAKLPPDHAERPLLKRQLDAAQTRARGGSFKDAYADLASVKNAAKGAARGYASSLSVDGVRPDLYAATERIGAIARGFENARSEMGKLIDRVKAHGKGSDCATVEEASVFRRDLTETEAGWRGEIASLRREVATAATSADGLQVESTLALLAHRLNVLQQTTSGAQKTTAEVMGRQVLRLNQEAKLGGRYMTKNVVTENFEKLVFDFEDALKPIKNISHLQQRESPSAPRTQMLDDLAELDKREEARLLDAQLRYLEEMGNDLTVLPDNAAPGARPPAVVLGQFSADDVVPPAADAQLDSDLISGLSEQAVDNLRKLMASEPANSDKLFDLMLKTERELRADIARSMGLPDNDAVWRPEDAELVKTMARALHETVLAESPNRAPDDLSSVTLGDKTYRNKQMIGKGGMGEIYRYTSDTGEAVIVKALKVNFDDEKDDRRAEMVHEMQMHRQVSGGENGRPHPNVVPMKGGAVCPDGTLLMLMDEAEGGDVKTLSAAVNELSLSGLIPEAARTAMVQTVMQQAVKGLMAVHAQDAMHLDIKGQNYLLAADGTVQVADFGSAQPVGDDGKVDTRGVPTTTVMAPPEYGAKMSPQDEVFWLGSMLQSLSASEQGVGSAEKADARWPGDMQRLRSKDEDGAINQETALDRLRNAMLDPDPAKRPKLESVLMSSYLTEVGRAYGEKEIAALMKAVTAYNQKVGREVSKIADILNYRRAQIAKEAVPANASASDKAKAEEATRAWRIEVAAEQVKLDEINKRADVKPLLDAIQQASAAFR